MDKRELESLLNDLESDRAERKASPSDVDKIRKAVCAFANDLPDHRRPAVIFVGVNDDGTCAHLEVTDRLLRKLSETHSDGTVTPFPTMTVQKTILNGCELAVVTVEPSDFPPVRLRGRVYVRVGPTTRIANAQDEQRLNEKRRAGDIPFDLQPVSSATLDDLDLDLFRRTYLPASVAAELLEENQRPAEQQLASLRLTTAEPQSRPTVLGVLVIGTDPREFIPGAYIQFLRVDGTELTNPIKDEEEVSGPLPELLRKLDEKLTAHISVAVNVAGGPLEIRHPDYPIEALRQLGRNAVLHRIYEGTNAPVRMTWFSDRIEIQSPGGPFGQVTRDNFGQSDLTDYRNPHLAEAMKNLGYVQRFGLGIPLARKELEKNGNPPLEFTVEDTYILAVIRRRP